MSQPIETPSRRTARLVGIFFILTFVTSIPAVLLYGPILNETDYILGAGGVGRIQLGAFLEILLAIANIATAVVLFPVVRRYSESISLGYVASRIVESAIILVGVVSLLSLLTLRQDATGSDASMVLAGQSLIAIHDATFLLGPAFCAGFGNGLLLGYLMYKSGLVPRRMAMIGLIGGPIAFLSATLVLFGVYEQQSGVSFLMTLPEIVWEASFGIYLTFWGFKTPNPIATPHAAPVPAFA
jgi:uncharacterized protein DUF4386